MTRDKTGLKIYSSLSNEEYLLEGNKYKSNLFSFTYNNFNEKIRDFCYAGDWSCVLNVKTGIAKPCYDSKGWTQDFYNLDKKPFFYPIGKCKSQFCVNASHFCSLGVVPDRPCPTYYCLRNRYSTKYRKDLINPTMKKITDDKFLYKKSRKHKFIEKLILTGLGNKIYQKIMAFRNSSSI